MDKYTFDADEIFQDDPDNPDNVLMNIPDEISERMGWGVGDVLKITVEKGVITISKVENGEK
jgi:hypothetical protein